MQVKGRAGKVHQAGQADVPLLDGQETSAHQALTGINPVEQGFNP